MQNYKPKYFLLLFLLLLKIEHINAQDTFMEVGIGIGNVTGNRNARGKGELHLNIIKSYKFGQLGLDISTGGNFIPGITSIEDEIIEILASNDFKFTTLMVFYRLPIKKHLFVESRLGYPSLFSFVHTNDKTKISQPNFTAGLAIGGHINNFTLSLRYQYLGGTPNYEGTKNMTIVKSNSESLGLLLFRISNRFDLQNLFLNRMHIKELIKVLIRVILMYQYVFNHEINFLFCFENYVCTLKSKNTNYEKIIFSNCYCSFRII